MARNGTVTGFELPIRLRAHPPLPILAGLFLLHGGGAACLWFTALPLWAAAGLTGAVAADLVLAVRRYLRRVDWQLALNAADRWFIIDGQGGSRTVNPETGLFLHPVLAILIVRDRDGARVPFFLSPLNTDPDARRRLRVRMRFPKG